MNLLTCSPFPYGALSRPTTDAIATCVFAAASSAHAFDIPAGAQDILFSATCDFYVAWGSTGVAVPAADSTAGSTASISELNPTIRHCSTANTTGISLIASSSGVVTMAFFGS